MIAPERIYSSGGLKSSPGRAAISRENASAPIEGSVFRSPGDLIPGNGTVDVPALA
jgi:hypothetical protein